MEQLTPFNAARLWPYLAASQSHAAKVAALKSLPKQSQPLPVRVARPFNPF